MRLRCALLGLLAAPCAALGFDANGVALGGGEAAVKAAFPEAHCRALEWASDAADRRCDDARIVFAGAQARVTFYLKDGAVQAFDVRFRSSEFEKAAAQIKSRYGKPAKEGRETVPRRGKPPQEVYKLRWEKGKDHALFVAHPGGRNPQLTVWRGNFDSEIYRVK